jgi:hypothetical protein
MKGHFQDDRTRQEVLHAEVDLKDSQACSSPPVDVIGRKAHSFPDTFGR